MGRIELYTFNNAVDVECVGAHRWGGKRHRRNRRERIVTNRVRRLVRHTESQYLRSPDHRWHLVAGPGGEIVVHDFLTWTVVVDWANALHAERSA